MVVREFDQEDLPEIAVMMRNKLGVNENIVRSQIQSVGINDKIWILEDPELKGFAWAKLRADKLIVKYFYAEDPAYYKELLGAVEGFAELNRIKTVLFPFTNSENVELIKFLLEQAYVEQETQLLGKVYAKNF